MVLPSPVSELVLSRHRTSSADPFAAFLELRQIYGPREVFLLESLAGPAADMRSAAVGFGVLLGIEVRGDVVSVSGDEVLSERVTASLRSTGASQEDGTLRLSGSCGLFDVPRAVERALGPLGLDRSSFGYGYLVLYGYDVVHHVEDLPRTIPSADGPAADLRILLFRGIALVDLASDETTVSVLEAPHLPAVDVDRLLRALASPALDDDGAVQVPSPTSVSDSTTEARYHRDVEKALEHIAVGDIYQVQIGHEITIESSIDELDVYRRLRRRNPSPYMAIIPTGEETMISASPELFLRIQDDVMTMRPIAGTVARGATALEDDARRRSLREDEKEVAEHTMLVDLCRNDLSKVARVDTVEADELLVVEDYSHVFHLVSNVRARLDPSFDTQDVIAATFPAGTMTGAPKIRAMEIIEDREDRRRGFYAGAFGLMGLGGFVNLGLCIRTVFRSGTTYRTRASAGVVADSTPEGEWHETLAKLSAAYWAVTGEELA